MIILLSPAKTLDFESTSTTSYSDARLLKDSTKLVEVLKTMSPYDIRELMSVSEKIAELNVERYQQFSTPFSLNNAKQAVLAFKGDVYQGLEADTFEEEDLAFAQQHVRILSGLYGVLRPLDLMQPYRLEMGTKLQQNGSKNLYEFWASRITDLINDDLAASGSDVVLNLASKEYFKSVKEDQLKGKLIQVDFKEDRDGKYKIIAFNAKKARGAMTNQIVKHRIVDVASLKALNVEGYLFNDSLSSERHFVFTK